MAFWRSSDAQWEQTLRHQWKSNLGEASYDSAEAAPDVFTSDGLLPRMGFMGEHGLLAMLSAEIIHALI